MKRLLAILTVLLGFSYTSIATHVVGGELRVDQTGPNNFDVTLQVFRDCAPGNATLGSTLFGVRVYDAVTHTQITTFDVFGAATNPENITLGDSCYTPSGICLEGYIYTASITLANNPNGYYFAWDICCRNNIIDNLMSPGAEGSTFFCRIPDPAIAGQNSSPDFGPYPSEGYFCINTLNVFDVPATDPDGDSLSYELVHPYTDNTGGNYPTWGLVQFATGFNMGNIVGGAPPMTIDPVTGEVECQPTALGTYVFAVKVTEWRNGIAIGETIRDVQYHALNCTFDLPPEFVEAQEDTISFPVGEETCFDVISEDLDAQDTIFLELSSYTFSEGAYFTQGNIVQTTPDTMRHYGYFNTATSNPDSMLLPNMLISGNLYYEAGLVGMRFCWEPTCDHRSDSLYTVSALSYSLGCSGSDTTLKNYYVDVVPPIDLTPQFLIRQDTSREVEVLSSICFDIIAYDPDSGDTLFMEIDNNAMVPQGATVWSPGGQYSYYDDGLGQNVNLTIPSSTVPGAAYYTGVDYAAARFCWDPQCEHLDPIYPLYADAYSIGYCGDTSKSSHALTVDVLPIIPDYQKIPNVFTPNNDGVNDVFTIDRKHEPCFDFMDVQIYNRWGQLVFESDEPDFEWDGKNLNGKECSEGTFYVLINGVYASQEISNDDVGNADSRSTSKYAINLFR